MDGDAVLAHWYYEPGEWEYFVENDSSNVTHQMRFIVGAIAATWLACVIGAALFGWLLLDSAAAAVPVGCIGLPASLIVGGTFAADFYGRRKWFSNLRAAPREVIITDDEVIFGGHDADDMKMTKSLRWFGATTRVGIEPGDFSFLHFRIRHYVGGRDTEHVRVLIPRGQEREAAELLEHFGSHQRDPPGS